MKRTSENPLRNWTAYKASLKQGIGVKKLAESERKFRSYVENAADMLFIVNHRGFIEYVSPNCKSIMGYDIKELLSKNVYDFIENRNEPSTEKVFKKIADFKGKRYLEWRLRHKDGSYHWYGIKCSEHEDDKEKKRLCNVRNIDEKKAYEEELRTMSYVDALTGLENRLAFDRHLKRVKERRMGFYN